MEQIQIRQPKMPAAQSFIQVLGTFLAKLIIIIASHFYYVKLALSTIKQLKRLVSLNLFLKNLNLFIKEKISTRTNIKNLSYLLCFINFQIYFLLITWNIIICILKSRKIWFYHYWTFSKNRLIHWVHECINCDKLENLYFPRFNEVH